MLQTLRENPFVGKVILSAVLLVMVLGVGVGVTAVFSDLLGGNRGTGMDTGDAPWALRLGRDTISQPEFQQELRFVSGEIERQGMTRGPQFQSIVLSETVQRLRLRTLESQEARKAGLTVSDKELSDRIVSLPDFQRNGRFIGREEYQRLLEGAGYDTRSFEERIRRDILCAKWESLVSAGAIVTDREVDEELSHRNQKVRFDFAVVTPDKFPASAPPSETEIKSWYDEHADRYQRGEARRAKYVVMDTKDIEKQLPPPSDEEVRKAYDADAARWGGTFESKREEVKGQLAYSKALQETDSRAAVFKQDIKSKDAFDEAAAKKGLKVVDIGLVRHDDPMVAALGPEFQNALFSPAAVSTPSQARTAGGSVVFVVTDVRPAGRASLDEARNDVLSDVKSDKGRTAAMNAARQAIGSAAGDLAAVAAKLGVTVQSSPMVGKGDPVPSLGVEPAVQEAAFAATPGTIPAPVATAGGSVVVLKVAEKSSPEPGAAAAAREQVRSDLRRSREAALLESILQSAYKKTEFKANEEYLRQFGS